MLGLVLGFDAVGHCVAIATLVFAGPLAPGLGLGSALFLLSTLISTLILARWSGIPNALSVAQDATIAIVAALTAAAAANIAEPGARLPTALAIIGVSTLLSGLALYLMGRFGMGRVARVVPYPVALGFLASSGWLLTYAALTIITGLSGYGEVFGNLLSAENIRVSLPAAALALCLFLTLRFWSGAAAMMVVLAAFLVGFYLVLHLSGISTDQARSLGLIPAVPGISGPSGFDLPSMRLIDWGQLLQSGSGFAVIVVVNVIAFFLNSSGAELATQSDLDMNHELRLAGRTNLLLGLFGGLSSFLSTGSTIVVHKLGAGHRALTASYSLIVLLGCLFASQVVAAVPVFLTAGLLLFIGLSMLEDWLFRSYRRLVLQDWLIVLAIVAVTILQGIFAAIGAGLIFALAAFVLSYARVPMLRRKGAHQPRRSSVDRAPSQEAILREGWARVRLAQLQGFLFFGSIERLLSEVRGLPHQASRTEWLILDFASVTGLDSSTCAALEKLSYLSRTHGVQVQLCALSPDLSRFLTRWNPNFAHQFGFGLFDSLEAALEAAEDALLSEHPLIAPDGDGLAKLFSASAPDHPRLADLRSLLDLRHLGHGAVLIDKGSDQRDLYFVESGRLAVLLDAGAGQKVRVRSFTSGSVLGEVARYLAIPRTASVLSEGESTVYCLPASTLDRLEREDRDLAALIHAILARGLAEKVVRTNLLVTEF